MWAESSEGRGKLEAALQCFTARIKQKEQAPGAAASQLRSAKIPGKRRPARSATHRDSPQARLPQPLSGPEGQLLWRRQPGKRPAPPYKRSVIVGLKAWGLEHKPT